MPLPAGVGKEAKDGFQVKIQEEWMGLTCGQEGLYDFLIKCNLAQGRIRLGKGQEGLPTRRCQPLVPSHCCARQVCRAHGPPSDNNHHTAPAECGLTADIE
jgi:hypothetical protein